jgi:hypothetical protein
VSSCDSPLLNGSGYAIFILSLYLSSLSLPEGSLRGKEEGRRIMRKRKIKRKDERPGA